ncbi:MAG: hypothetical protein GXP29_05190 [Planctomycetes bacterium]|nr:hypothetical protein [Planctomycetota bacterium]
MNTPLKHIYRNLPNIVSILGVLPLYILLREDAFLYICPLIVFNNIMDDLDGALAKELGLRSKFGADLDNVCDAVSHILVAMVIGIHFGGVVSAFGVLAAVAILIRVVQRVDPSYVAGTGTATNELMRHLLLVLLLRESYRFDATPFIIAVYLLNSASMLAPFPMPHLVRSRAKTTTAVFMVNMALAVAWYVPETTPFLATIFFGTYLYSFLVSGSVWYRSV